MKKKPFGKKTYSNVFYGNPSESTSTIFYLKNLKKKDIRPLDRETEDRLLKEYHKQKNENNFINYEIRNKVVMANIKCVFSIVKRFEIYSAIDYDYALQEGIRGLIDAVDFYDISKLGKVRFYTYATYIIHRYITLYIMKDRHIVSLNEKTEQSNANIAKRLQHLENLLLSNYISNEEMLDIVKEINEIKSKGNINKMNNNTYSIEQMMSRCNNSTEHEQENMPDDYGSYSEPIDLNDISIDSIEKTNQVRDGYIIDINRKELLLLCANHESKILRNLLYDDISIETIALLAYNKVIFKILNGLNITLFLKQEDQNIIDRFMDVYNNLMPEKSNINGLRAYQMNKKLSEHTKNHIKKYMELLENIKEYDIDLYERLHY